MTNEQKKWAAWMNSNLPETKSPYLQGYSDALDERINLTAYDQHADYLEFHLQYPVAQKKVSTQRQG